MKKITRAAKSLASNIVVTRGTPQPAKKVNHLWFVATAKPPETWPRRFGEEHFDDAPVEAVLQRLKGDQVYVYYDDGAGNEDGAKVWAFKSQWKNYSRVYKNVQLDLMVDDVLNNEQPKMKCEIDTGSVFFVCGHGNRDERCGVRGEKIVTALRQRNQRTFACSHLGGHAFAGNVIQLPQASWYSFVEDYSVGEVLSGQTESVVFRGSSW